MIPPRADYDLTCRVALAQTAPDLHLIAVLPHMHGYGRSLAQTLHFSGGAPPIELANVSTWDVTPRA